MSGAPLSTPEGSRPVKIKIGSLDAPQDVLRAVATVVGTVARGVITPSEGQALASLIEVQRKAVETVEIEARVAA